MAECKGIAGRLFGHNFQPRYTESQALASDIARVLDNTADPWKEEVLHAATTVSTQYHGDVCCRCGEVRASGVIASDGGQQP